MKQQYCAICGNKIPDSRLREYKTTCCKSCASKLRFRNQEERKRFSLVMKQAITEEVRQKISQTLKNPEYLSEQQRRQKKLSENKSVQKKKSGTLKNYWKIADREEHSNKIKLGQIASNAHEKISLASKNNWQNDEYRQKVIQHIKQSWTIDKRANHSLKMSEIYQSEDMKQKIGRAVSESLSNPIIKQKQLDGIKKALGRAETKRKLSNSIKLAYKNNGDEIISKRIQTMKNNSSFSFSKDEDLACTLLNTVFNEVDKQHRSNIYPYNCDFYVPSLDLYIECNFHWTHGGMPFNENDKHCIEKLNNWQDKAKASKFYQNAINTWTKRDVEKLECAIKNNLNWLCFYTIGEFKQWLNTLI